MQVFGQRAPQPLVVGDGDGQGRERRLVGLVQRAETVRDAGEDRVLGAAVRCGSALAALA